MRWLTAILVALAACAGLNDTAAPSYDVVVYGGTSGGVVAAVQAARMGRTVLLIEPTRHLGGLSSSGLGATDIGNKAAIGGVSREFYRRIRAHYANDAAWTFERREAFRGRGHRKGEDAAWTFEPKVAEKVFGDLLAETSVEVRFGQRLVRDGRHVRKDGARIVRIGLDNGEWVAGSMFIDATYEGDLLAEAGVSYVVGREANSEFGETLNGVQRANAKHHQFVEPVDPYVEPGRPESGLLPGLLATPPGPDGSADKGVQAYCFRLCATNEPSNRRPWPKPADYDEADYELLLRNFEAGDLRRPWNPVRMPNKKTDSNNNFAISTDFIGHSHEYPDADYATRARIVAEHERWQKGLMWTLANHPRVPESVRAYFSRYGLARDEFTDNDNWPRQLYIREARRMRSAVVMTEHHCRGQVKAEDSIGMAAYTMDSHNVHRYVDENGHARNEGDVQVGGFPPYPISYRSIVPNANECTNLLVPVCLSATHIAYGSIRMEPVFMVLGQSAATAASLAVEAGVSVQDVALDALTARLRADGQVLSR